MPEYEKSQPRTGETNERLLLQTTLCRDKFIATSLTLQRKFCGIRSVAILSIEALTDHISLTVNFASNWRVARRQQQPPKSMYS
jgi:hypothetical protein